MDDTSLIENGIISTFTYDIDNACRYAWGFDTKSAVYYILKNINNPYKYIYSKHLYNMRRKCIAKVGRYFPTNLLKLISINLYGV